MAKRSFIVSIIPTHPFLMKRKFLRNKHHMFKDTEMNLLDTLEKELNFKYRTTFPYDCQWGSEKPDGSWSGIIGQVDTGEADFGVSYMTLTYERYKVLNYTKPYFTSKLSFFTQAPTLSTPNLKTLLRPFTWQLWCALLIAFIVLTSVIYLMGKFHVPSIKRPKISSIIWFLFGICIYQGGDFNTSEKTRCRLLIACWLLTIIVLTPTYSGILTSLLALPVKHYVAENIKELNEGARTGKIKVGTVNGSAYYHNILSTPNKQWKYIKESIQKKTNMASGHQEGFERIYNEPDYAFICAEEVGLFITRKAGIRKFYGSKDIFYENYNGIVTRRNFPLMKEFNNIITRTTESGLISHWNALMHAVETYKAEIAYPEDNSKPDDVGFGIMLGPFLILLAGYALSTIVLITEIIISCIMKRKR